MAQIILYIFLLFINKSSHASNLNKECQEHNKPHLQLTHLQEALKDLVDIHGYISSNYCNDYVVIALSHKKPLSLYEFYRQGNAYMNPEYGIITPPTQAIDLNEPILIEVKSKGYVDVPRDTYYRYKDTARKEKMHRLVEAGPKHRYFLSANSSILKITWKNQGIKSCSSKEKISILKTALEDIFNNGIYLSGKLFDYDWSQDTASAFEHLAIYYGDSELFNSYYSDYISKKE